MKYSFALKPVENVYWETPIACNHWVISDLLLTQWKRLNKAELEATRFLKSKIAKLVERKYGIHSFLVENYLSNLERTLPLKAQ